MYYICHKSIEVDLKSKTEMWAIDDLQTRTAGVQGARLSSLKLLLRKVIPWGLIRNPGSEQMRKKGR